MGGNDVYCALCGVIAGTVVTDDDIADDEEWTYDQDRIAGLDTDWLADVRILAENPKSSSMQKVFLSDCATYDDSNYFDLEAEDPMSTEFDSSSIRVYDWEEAYSVAIPFHLDCFKILEKIAAPQAIDYQILYEILKLHCGKDIEYCLDYDYGEVTELQDQYWLTRRNTEYVIASPTNISRVDQLTESILQDSQRESESVLPYDEERPSSSDNPFDSLPNELLLKMLSSLDVTSVCRLRSVSRRLRAVVATDSFWRGRVEEDMPWMTEFLQSQDNTDDENIDWQKVYQTLRCVSMGRGSMDNLPSLGFQNRSRIWEICSGVMKEYSSLHQKHEREREKENVILKDAKSSPMPTLTFPKQKNTTITSFGLADELNELSHAHPTILTSWTATNGLVGIAARYSGVYVSQQFGTRNMDGHIEEFEMPRDDWLSGLIITSQSVPKQEDTPDLQRKIVGLKLLFNRRDPIQFGSSHGDLRLLRVGPEQFIVGFTVTWAVGKPIEKLAILQQPIAKAILGGRERLTPTETLPLDPIAMEYLWKDRLPADGLRVAPFSSGYWNYDFQADESPMESLIFGTSDEELGKIVAIGMDVQFRGIEVVYADGHHRSIGPGLNAMQYMSIDGSSGERIVCFYTTQHHIVPGIRFVTNRGRQLVIGQPGPREKRYPSQDENGDDEIAMGVYGHWASRDTPKVNLAAVGGLSASLTVSLGPDPQTDIHGLHWNLGPPAYEFRETGTIYGWRQAENPRTMRRERTPSEQATVSWLDCGRTLKSVRLTLCHGTRSSQLPLVAISFTYADELTVSSIGPTEFSPPQDTEGRNGHYWCWCALGSSRSNELESQPHYVHHEWHVEGQILQTLNLWIDPEGVLTGLQFEAHGGNKSPEWGYCEEGRLVKMDLRVESGWSSGLKFFLDSNHRNVTREDHVVVAVQLLRLRTNQTL
ncbi:hypothetical protein NW762_011011 [Fusarium torreyae]|uniref:F-box domain-containing protein n=1 Tax=Fusarium torreyae TaxID=1237075 RepID=A0A9W8VCY6_9HYPO|nr:hypothetical protein NW762_011011 [Fusarium torreyae]